MKPPRRCPSSRSPPYSIHSCRPSLTSHAVRSGATNFTRLNLTVVPKRGSAILWPSVLSDDPWVTDERTRHESLPVVRGTKFAANFWIHMFEFQDAHNRGCSNTNYVQEDALPAGAAVTETSGSADVLAS